MKFTGPLAVAGVAATALLLAGGPTTAASVSCNSRFTSVATVAAARTTTSKTPVNLTGATVAVGSAAGCVRVQFTAQVKAPSPRGLRVRLLIDGRPAGAPAVVNFQTTGNGYDNRSATFVEANVADRPHTFQIQFSSVDGKAVAVAKTVVTVWFTEAL